jgi:hypothetical protein
MDLRLNPTTMPVAVRPNLHAGLRAALGVSQADFRRA